MTEDENAEAEGESSVEEEEAIEEVVEPTPEELIAAAEAKAEAAEKEIGYRDAEIQNVQRRLAKEKSELIQYASMNLSRRMLSVIDDVDRALANIPAEVSGEIKPVLDGLKLLRDKTWTELKASGVAAMESKGKPFNPKNHEALTTIPATEEFPAGTIIDVIEPGYMFKERLLRAAKVVVSS
ncbi:MAG: nucleotide exchange factor GrpE [Euryarchaeota archaeon]|nr:nucleotide exchange factor GrpE [Euryarchaeota archaeon]MBT7938546.1 nucleotide exchange factor GrpE [Euryarchaeota archaeon]